MNEKMLNTMREIEIFQKRILLFIPILSVLLALIYQTIALLCIQFNSVLNEC
jgi:hypothetical protein